MLRVAMIKPVTAKQTNRQEVIHESNNYSDTAFGSCLGVLFQRQQ